MSDPLSPASLAAVPEVRKAFGAVGCSDKFYNISEPPCDRCQSALLLAVRDATLKAERERLAQMTPEEVVEAARTATWAIISEYKAPKPAPAHYPWIPLSDAEKMTDAVVNGLLPLLLAPEVAKREQVGRERERQYEETVAQIARVGAAEAEVTRLRGALEKLAHPSEGACPICAARAALGGAK